MSTEQPSIFTRIINRDIPADIVYEDDLVIAFFTIEPINPGHTLVVPKKPFRNLLDGDDYILGHMTVVAKKIGNALIKVGLGTGINLIMNNEPDASQEVFHAHMHVVPRIKNDESFTIPKHTSQTPEQIKVVAALLQKELV